MRKHTTLDLDQDLLRDAAAALGTTRATETIHAALAEAVARRRRELLGTLELPDLTPGFVASMRTTRTFTTTGSERPRRTAKPR